MRWIVHVESQGYVIKEGGWVLFTEDPLRATSYACKEDAGSRGKIGHHQDMGGSGFKGQVVKQPA